MEQYAWTKTKAPKPQVKAATRTTSRSDGKDPPSIAQFQSINS